MAANIDVDVKSIPYTCPSCDAPVGDLVPVNGFIRLDTGDWLMGEGQRHCHRCGRLIHFKAPKETWEEFKTRYLQRCGLLAKPIPANSAAAGERRL